MESDGRVPRRRGGREHRADTNDEPQPQVEPEHDQMDMEHQLEDNDEAEEDVGDDDGQQQQQGR